MITYFVEGYHDLPLYPDEPDPPTLFNNSITGTAVGPVGAVGGVDEGPLPLAIAELRPPVPNPTRATVTVAFYLPEPSHVVLVVYDVAGRRVRVLVDGDRPSGVYSSSWNGYDENGRRASAGVYSYQLHVGGKPAGTGKMVIVP
jgi:flagellar hook assembly protein FlgD